MGLYLNCRALAAGRERRGTMRCRRAGSRAGWLLMLAAATALAASCGPQPADAQLFVVQTRSDDSVPRYGVFELSLRHNGHYDNNFLDVTVVSLFTAPSGAHRTVQGFYHGGDVWKVRFSPDELGNWTYTYLMHGKGGFRQQGFGVFECRPSERGGPVRRNPNNPYRWQFEDGGNAPAVHPYVAVGIQDCMGVRDGQLTAKSIDGEERGRPARTVSIDEYFAIYGQAGFNLFRFSQQNCSYRLFDDLDHYREAEAIATDDLLARAREHDIRVMFGFFGFSDRGKEGGGLSGLLRRLIGDAWGAQDDVISARDRATLFKQQRFVDYCVARWGVYVDFWELLNERYATDEWTSLMAAHVRAVDPDHKPIGTSYEKPYVPTIDINAPHWYESESELDSDLRVQQRAAEWKQAGKPVVVGEQGNTGMNWDPLSGTRMRIRSWTALFQEISLVFWNTSWSKAGMNDGRYMPETAANIYLGPEEREYIRALQDFSTRLDADVHMAGVALSAEGPVRAYGLLSGRVAAAYLHHVENHTTMVRGLRVALDTPPAGEGTPALVAEWIDPPTGRLLACTPVRDAHPTLDVPPFSVDLALLVTHESAACRDAASESAPQ